MMGLSAGGHCRRLPADLLQRAHHCPLGGRPVPGVLRRLSCYLVLAALGHSTLPRFSAAMLSFAIPLTLVTLGVVTVRGLRQGRQARTGQAS